MNFKSKNSKLNKGRALEQNWLFRTGLKGIGRKIAFSSLLVMTIGFFTNPFDSGLALLSYAGLVVAVFPLLSFIATKELKHVSIFIPLLLTWIYFLAPFLYDEPIVHSYRNVPEVFFPQMALSAAGSLLAMCVGFYFSFSSKRKTTISGRKFRLSERQLSTLILICIFMGVSSNILRYYAPEILKPFGQIFALLDFAPVLAIALGVLYLLRGGRAAVVIAPATFYLVFEILLRVSETLFSKIIYMVAAIILVVIFERRKIPWVTIAICFVSIFPLFNARMNFRMEAHERWHYEKFEEKEKIPGLLGRGLENLRESYAIWNWDDFGQSVQDQSQTRFEGISYFGQCVFVVKTEKKELKYGETFWWLPLTPVPRVIIPWKPRNYHATDLAVEYGVKGEDSKAAMNFPMLVEFYINFGFIGVVVCSFFQGALYKWCFRFAAFGQGDLNMLFFVNILWHLEKVESNVTLIFGGIFQAILSWWFLAKIVNLNFRGKLFK